MGRATCKAAAPRTGLSCISGCCSSDGCGVLLKLMLLRCGWAAPMASDFQIGSTTHVAPAPWTGVSCAGSCCWLDGGGTRTAVAPQIGVGMSVAAPQRGGRLLTQLLFLGQGRPREVTTHGFGEGYPWRCCSLDVCGLLTWLLLTWSQCPSHYPVVLCPSKLQIVSLAVSTSSFRGGYYSI